MGKNERKPGDFFKEIIEKDPSKLTLQEIKVALEEKKGSGLKSGYSDSNFVKGRGVVPYSK